MTGVDFPTWYSVGAYGGLLCALATAGGAAVVGLRGRRGTPRQVSVAVLACLICACLMLPAVWWNLNQLGVYGPLLSDGQVTLWLVWAAVLGWGAPLLTLAAFWSFAAPQRAAATAISGAPTRSNSGMPLASLSDPLREREPLGPGRAWGRFVALDEPFAGRALLLTRQLTLLGREVDNDLVLDDERCSRYHAEIHWDHGHVQLVDRHSTNGTLLNRQVVRGPVPLQPGDVVELGTRRYRFELVAPGQADGSVAEMPHAIPETRKMPGAPTVALLFDGTPLALVALTGPVAGTRWLLGAGVTSIGREGECDICVPDASVSRVHAQVVCQRTGYFVSDLQSSNGTQLNGHTLTAPAVLTAGDVVQVGEITLRCEPDAKPDAPPQTGAASGGHASLPTAPPAGVFTNSGIPHPRSQARLGPPRLTPSDPPAPENDPLW
ncbi:MAG: FHA domain-containing protein [Ktedonobacterales bacterium]